MNFLSRLRRKSRSKDAISVVTRAFHDHAYIDHFIEYYLALGFDNIYILFEANQKPLQIRAKYRTCVKIIQHDRPSNDSANDVLRFLPMFFNEIETDWFLLCDSDEYLYLKNFKSIREFLEFIPDDVGQAFFQWVMIENFSHMKDDFNLLDLASTHKSYMNNYVKPFVRKDTIICNRTSHNFSHRGKDYAFWRYTDNRDMMASNVAANFVDTTYPFMIHFHTRSLVNMFIKGFSCGYEEKSMLSNIGSALRGYERDQNVDQLLNCFHKARLPFCHSQLGDIGDFDYAFSPMDSNIEIGKDELILRELSHDHRLDYSLLEAIIKDLDKNYGMTFKRG